MDFWSRLEDRLIALQKDRLRAARYMQIAWWIANGFVLLGIIVIFLIAFGVWSP